MVKRLACWNRDRSGSAPGTGERQPAEVDRDHNCTAIRNLPMPRSLDRVERDPYYDKTYKFRHLLDKNGLGDFTVGRDGSEFEIKTPILSGPTGFKKMKRFLDLMKEMGARTSIDSDGLHVHHDAPEFIRGGVYQKDTVTALVQNWYKIQNSVMDLVHDCRNNRWACHSWTDTEVANVVNNFELYAARMGRKNLNIASLRRHGTIELRLHEGTLNYEEVLSWVRFGQAFIQKAVEQAEVEAQDSFELLQKVNVSRNASRFLTQKIESKRRGRLTPFYA